MGRRSYPGWSHDQALKHFLEMRPFRSHLLAISDAHFPQTPEHRALDAIVEAIDAAAEHFGLDHHALYAPSDGARHERVYFRP